MLFTLAMMLFRTIMAFLVALTAIMFLTSIGPIMFSFALFQSTRALFNQWVNMLMGFALQIVIVFAFCSLVFTLPISTIFGNLYNLSAPVQSTMAQANTRVPMQNMCTFCTTGLPAAGGGACPNSIYPGQGSPAQQPTELMRNIDFLGFSTTIILSLLVLARILEATIRIAPRIAEGLSRTPFSPALNSNSSMFGQVAGRALGGGGSGGRGLGRFGAAAPEPALPPAVAGGQQSGVSLVGRR
jgi:type IV secretory pathway VirB6-like protein